jgi:hypothetical protein
MFGNFGKKDKKEMNPAEKKAKLKALGAANGMASDMLKDHLQGLKKVTVASDSKEGLKEGLKKAEDIVGKKSDSPFDNSEDDSAEHEDAESGSEEEYEDASDDILAQCDTEDEINDLIAKLEEKKKSLQS